TQNEALLCVSVRASYVPMEGTIDREVRDCPGSQVKITQSFREGRAFFQCHCSRGSIAQTELQDTYSQKSPGLDRDHPCRGSGFFGKLFGTPQDIYQPLQAFHSITT